MGLNKNRVKKLEENSTQSNEQNSLGLLIDGIVSFNDREYKKEEFEKLYPDVELIIIEFKQNPRNEC